MVRISASVYVCVWLFSSVVLLLQQPADSSFIAMPWASSPFNSLTSPYSSRTDEYFDKFFASSSTSSNHPVEAENHPSSTSTTATGSSSTAVTAPVSTAARVATLGDIDLSQYEDTTSAVYDMGAALPYQDELLTIDVASTEYATVYLNGLKVGSVKDWASWKQFQVKCGLNDVIAITAMNLQGWHGIITDMAIGNNRFFTGGNGFKIRIDPNDPTSDWKLPGSRDACGTDWKKPVPMSRPIHDRFAKTYPYKDGAKYVWAPDAPAIGHVQLRYVFGDDHCKDINKPIPGDNGPKECPCREVVTDNPGTCYEFNYQDAFDKFYIPRKCTSRDCAPKYECLPEQMAGTGRVISTTTASSTEETICMKRYAKSAVIPKHPGRLNTKCVQVKLFPPTPFYSPYS